MAYAPFMDCVAVGVAAVQLGGPSTSLLGAIDPRLAGLRAGKVRLEFDQTQTGNLYIGGSNVAAAHCGAHLVPGQAYTIDLGDGNNLILLSDIWMVADGASKQVNVTVFPKGM